MFKNNFCSKFNLKMTPIEKIIAVKCAKLSYQKLQIVQIAFSSIEDYYES